MKESPRNLKRIYDNSLESSVGSRPKLPLRGVASPVKREQISKSKSPKEYQNGSFIVKYRNLVVESTEQRLTLMKEVSDLKNELKETQQKCRNQA